MDKIVIFDTSYGTYNMGDYIINECASNELKFITEKNFCVRIGTHNPVAHFYQLNKKRKTIKFFDEAKYKFVTGTNIIKKNMLHPWEDWNVNIFNCYPYKNSILMGVGLSGNKTNLYTKRLYKKMLNKEFYHSVRDEKTKKYLESIGIKAINTGCPTLWSINDELCKIIPTKKSDKVIFTLTDYAQDRNKDQKLINILKNNYKEVYIWIQGSRDYDYFRTFLNIDNINIIAPNIQAYHEFLEKNDVDYIGTRLHAGIYAIRHKKRSIIIAVDNRARDMNETYNLNVLERNKINKLDNIINSNFKTSININHENIEKWKNQFK